MGRLFVVHLEGKIYTCRHCRTHLALSEDVISKVSAFPFVFLNFNFKFYLLIWVVAF